LSEEKDPELAIRVLAALRTPGAILAMIGDGPLMDTVRHLAAYLGVQDRVRLLGVHPDARRLLRAFDTVLLTSRTEGTPMVILEAAEAQVPVVATAVGGVPDLLGSDAATLAPHGDVDRLASAVSALLEDTAMAQREAEHLNERIRKGASEDWIDAYLQLYRSLGAAGTRLRR
jgi:glycosyltransferase involved in cell wall biosynthesis